MNIVQGINTVIEDSQSSPASEGLGAIIVIGAIILVFALFKKDKW